MKHLFSLALCPIVLFAEVYNETEFFRLEEQIPELAVMALKTAYQEALDSGSCVLIVKDGALIEVAPNGNERIIKEMPNWIPVTPGKYVRISIEIEESTRQISN